MIKVSIITVSYNSASTILDTFQSIRNQTYKNIEYIVVDGKSSDLTVELVKKNSDIISKFISENDKGIYDAMNKGVSMATGDIIGILNSDDFYFDNTVIEKIVKSFTKNKCDSVYTNIIYVNSKNTSKIDRFWKSKDFNRNSFLYGWMPPHPGFFVKKEVYLKYGKFDTSLVSASDYEFMLRILFRYKISSFYENFISVKMRSGGVSNSSISSRIKANTEDRLAWKKNNLNPYFFTLLLKPLRKINQFFQRPR